MIYCWTTILYQSTGHKNTNEEFKIPLYHRIIFIYLTSLLVSLLIPLSGYATDQNNIKPVMRILKSASELDYPPFCLVKKDGSADGFSVELLKAVTQTVGLDITFDIAPWNEIKQKLIDGQIDVLPFVSYSKERDNEFDFTAPYLRMHGTIFVRKEETSIRTEADLKDKEVLVMRGDTAHEYAVKRNISNHLILTDSFEQAMRQLSSGKHDAVIIQQLAGIQLIKHLNITNIVDVDSFRDTNLKIKDKPLEGFEQKFCIAVKEGDKELLARLNEGLAIVIANGIYDNLYDKWFSPILPKPSVDMMTMIRYLFYILLPTLFFIGVFGIWYLKKEVARKTNYLSKEITDRIQAEEALRELEAKQSTMISNISDVIGIIGIDGILKYKSPNMKKWFGWKPQDLIGTDGWLTVHPDDLERIQKEFYTILEKDNSSTTVEYQYKCKDGSYKPIELTATNLTNNPVIAGVLLNYHDITERKRAEEALQDSEALFRDTFEHSSIGKSLTAPNGRLLKVNKAFADMLGYTKEEMQQLDFETITHSDDTDKSLKGFRSVLSGENDVFRCKKRYIHKNKETIWADINVNLLRNEQGKPLYFITGIIDITKSVMAEEAMRENERKLNMIFSAMTEMVVLHELVLDEQGDAVNYRILDCNHAFTEVTGLQKEKVIGKQATEVYETKIPPYLDTYSKVAITGLPAKFTAYFPPMNKYFIISIVSPKKNHFLTVTTDITENKRDELVREKLQAQLSQAQKMESIGTLAGGIAHDFNNILFPIVGHTEMLIEDFPEDSPLRESLNEIYTGALRARDLVQQILAFSRQEKSELKLMKMQPIIKEALKLIRSTIPTTISINQNIQPNCGAVKADPTQIHQIVMNLTTNAYHAMEENGGELKVNLKEIKLGEYELINPDMMPGSYACLIIADTGTGMDKKTIDKIFDPFFTTKERGKGTGMGLSVVHGIVKSMNGDIQVHSEPGKGTEFHIFLPIIKSDFEKQATQTNEPILGGTESVLLVDDEKSIIAMEKQALERLGYQVTSRISSIEALEAFLADPDKFDLVITDMAMPKMPGDKLAIELIKIRHDIPVLLCTGFSETMTEEKIKSIGIKGLLLKPIIIKDLAKKVREVLDK
jgi:PAS domain S-box-containing protein